MPDPHHDRSEVGLFHRCGRLVGGQPTDVGGDLYDFLALEDGRLAVVLGDVTGHGVDATADMAMAKFVFRSLAREHPEPSDFLASANDVICSEIGPGKFISMSYVVVDGGSGRVSVASAGHPAPRIVLRDGSTRPLEAHGLVLGIDGGQEYAESHAELPSGAHAGSADTRPTPVAGHPVVTSRPSGPTPAPAGMRRFRGREVG